MNITEHIIQAALLGTANCEFSAESLPGALQSLADRISEKSEDQEAFLYMTSASAFAYSRAGWEPALAKGFVPMKTAPKEELPYFNKAQSSMAPEIDHLSF